MNHEQYLLMSQSKEVPDTYVINLLFIWLVVTSVLNLSFIFNISSNFHIAKFIKLTENILY